MEKNFTLFELLDVINLCREKEDLIPYTAHQLSNDMDEDDVLDDTNISLIQAIGLLAYQSHYVRIVATKELLKEEYMSVGDYCKKNDISADYGEIIAISKVCQKISTAENKNVKSRINKNNKPVKMFHFSVLNKALKIR